jgi:hypothetical protein
LLDAFISRDQADITLPSKRNNESIRRIGVEFSWQELRLNGQLVIDWHILNAFYGLRRGNPLDDVHSQNKALLFNQQRDLPGGYCRN